jgi:hypothetical protein
MLRSRALRSLWVACLPLIVLACGLEGETTDTSGAGAPPPGVATGNIAVRLAVTGTNLDGEEDAVGGVNVTISDVTIFPVEGGSGVPGVGSLGPVALLGGPVGFELLALAGNPVMLTSGTVPAGDYDRLRVVVSGASVSLPGGVTNALDVENGTVEKGMNVHVGEGETATVTVTINIRESIRLNRNNRGSFQPQVQISD